MGKSEYYSNCVHYPDIDELQYIVDVNKEITYKTFRSHVDTESFNAIKESLGYTAELGRKYNLTIQNDYAVSFHKSKTPKGEIVYYINHSAIEYIFK